jgi:hypothetical protein
MKFSGLIPYALAVVAVGGVALAQSSPSSPPEQFPLSPPEQNAETPVSNSPQRLTIRVTVADPEDLKVAEGDRVEVGQLIADRGRERRRLEVQQAQLQLSLQQLESSTVTAPAAPAQAPAIASPTYLEQQAAIDRAKATVDMAEMAIANKQQEIDYLSALPNLDPLVLEHERVKLADLQRQHTAAVRDYQLAVGRKSTAEYEHSVRLAATAASQNQSTLSYQQQWAQYEQRLRDRDFQLSQTQLRLNEVDYAITTLAVVRSAYAGRVRRVRWMGQGADGSLSVELTLLIRESSDEATVPGQFDDLPSEAD